MYKVSKLCLILSIVVLAGCGSGPGRQDAGREHSIGNGSISMTVSNSKSAGGEENYANVQKYKVIVTGGGIDGEIVKEFDGGSEGGAIDNVPAGDGRRVAVEAYNYDGEIMREGLVESVTVISDSTADVEITMEAIPLFVTPKNGDVVPSNRLGFKIFSDPNEPLEVNDKSEEKEGLLTDKGSGLDEVYPDLETGLASFVPVRVNAGEHVFYARSKVTGRYSSIKIRVIDIAGIKPASLYSGGHIYNEGAKATAAVIGTAFSGGTNDLIFNLHKVGR